MAALNRTIDRAPTSPSESAIDDLTTLMISIVVIASGVVGALHRALNDRPDWEDLARESRQVWESGRSLPGTAMFGYLPTTTFALWQFTAWTPRGVGIGLFVTSNLLAALASVFDSLKDAK